MADDRPFSEKWFHRLGLAVLVGGGLGVLAKGLASSSRASVPRIGLEPEQLDRKLLSELEETLSPLINLLFENGRSAGYIMAKARVALLRQDEDEVRRLIKPIMEIKNEWERRGFLGDPVGRQPTFAEIGPQINQLSQLAAREEGRDEQALVSKGLAFCINCLRIAVNEGTRCSRCGEEFLEWW
jgi:hypothetical protein